MSYIKWIAEIKDLGLQQYAAWFLCRNQTIKTGSTEDVYNSCLEQLALNTIAQSSNQKRSKISRFSNYSI